MTMEPQVTLQMKIEHFFKHRIIKRIAEKCGFAIYEPNYEYKSLLKEKTEFAVISKPIRDKRPTTANEKGLDQTITVDGLEDVLNVDDFKGKRVLEVGPKYGIHSRWIDQRLKPSEIVFCDFPSEKWRHETWDKEIKAPHRWVYGDLRKANELLTMEPFDLVFFLGVMHHSAYHLQLLSMLNRVTRRGGSMLLETTYNPSQDAVLRVNWQAKTGKAKLVPSVDALRIMLAWTGWRKACIFKDYRPMSSELIMLCEKTDDIVSAESDFCAVVTTTRLGPDGKPLSTEEGKE